MPDSLRETLDHALGAQYTIQRLLGRGGMGAVYLALDRSLERRGIRLLHCMTDVEVITNQATISSIHAR